MTGRPGPRRFEVEERALVHRSRKYRCAKESVRFEDGRTGSVRAELRINPAKAFAAQAERAAA